MDYIMNIKITIKQEELKRQIDNLSKAITYAQSNQNEIFFEYIQESVIQRFEYTFESSWKLLKLVLKEYHDWNDSWGPKEVLKQAEKNNYLQHGFEWMDMLEARNLSSHSYEEYHAQAIYTKVLSYLDEFTLLYDTISHKLR